MLNIHKKAGETMDQLVCRVKKEHLINKLGYTARLDPMAKGIVPFVTNGLCSDIGKHLGSGKTYQVKIILGIQTDSDDPLGLITGTTIIDEEILSHTRKSIINYLNLINGTSFRQKYHHYSTKMMNHRRHKNTNVIDNHQVSVFDYEILGEGINNYGLWSAKIITQINSIDPTKNFRQRKTIEQWNNFLTDKLFYIKLKIKVSSGFFIRQLVRDISNHIGIPLMCYNINRVCVD
jgi:tRNA pseudouridine(55) synthase